MINVSKSLKARQAVFDTAEEQVDLLRDAGMKDNQRMEFYQDLADHFAGLADEFNDLQADSEDEEFDDEDDEGELDD